MGTDALGNYPDQWDTPMNRAQGFGDGATPTVDVTPDDAALLDAGMASLPAAPSAEDMVEEAPWQIPEDVDWVRLAQQSMRQGRAHIATNLQRRWGDSYRAYNNEHYAGSKYTMPQWRGRTRLFVPKTRAAVRAADAAKAAALFSTADPTTITASDDSEEWQRNCATFIREAVTYRLDRANGNAAIPWFPIAIGAGQTAQIAGICVSKQYWEREINPATGKVRKNRPYIQLYPPEAVLRDQGGDWVNQAQRSSFIVLQNPMSIGDIRLMVSRTEKQGGLRWIEPSESELKQAIGNYDQRMVRQTREGKNRQDPTENANVTIDDFRIVWANEVFLRHDGVEYVYWMLGENTLLSHPALVEDVYPEQGGERPITLGYGSLEAFKTDPMSQVESWTPLQAETNDQTNLRLDNMKQILSPLTIARAGRNINIEALQNRTPDSVIYTREPSTDINFDRPPAFDSSAYAEQDRLSANFDELAGMFSSASVNTNRQLNETVGGMQLLSGAANAIGEFDLRVWVETWVEPTLRQIVRLEQYYEDDPAIILLAGKKAGMWRSQAEAAGINDEMLDRLFFNDVVVRVNVGVGAADPNQRLQKIAASADVMAKTIGPLVAPRLKADEFFDEIMAPAGYKNASQRFLEPAENLAPLQQQIQQLQAEVEDKKAERESKERIAQMNNSTKLLEQQMEGQQDMQMAQHQARMGLVQGAIQGRQDERAREFQAGEAERGREHETESQERNNQARAESEERRAAAGPQAPGGGAGGRQQPDLMQALQALATLFYPLAAPKTVRMERGQDGQLRGTVVPQQPQGNRMPDIREVLAMISAPKQVQMQRDPRTGQLTASVGPAQPQPQQPAAQSPMPQALPAPMVQ